MWFILCTNGNVCFSLEREKYNRTDLQTSEFWVTQLGCS